MNQNSGNQNSTYSTNIVASDHQLTESQNETYRTSNERSAMKSSDCANKELRDTQERNHPTDIAEGASTANKPSEDAGSGCKLDTNSIAQDNSGRGRTSPIDGILGPPLLPGYRSLLYHSEESSDEDNGDINRPSGPILPTPITQRRKRPRCDSNLSEVKVVHVSAAEEIASLKDQLLAVQRTREQEKRQYEDQEWYDHHRITELEERNTQLEQGDIPVLKYCHEQKAEMNHRIRQDYDEGVKFVQNVLQAAVRFCVDTHAEAMHFGLLTQDFVDAYLDFRRAGFRYLNEIDDAVNYFKRQSQERVWDLDRLITQEEFRAEVIRFQIDECMRSVQALSGQRSRSLVFKRDEFRLVFQGYYAECRKIWPDDEVRANQYHNICKDLDEMSDQNCAARQL